MTNKLTRFYTEMPNCHLLLALTEYFKPKVLQLKAGRSSETILSGNIDELCQRRSTSMSLSVANRLFVVLIAERIRVVGCVLTILKK